MVLRRAMDGMETELKASDGAETSLIFTSVELEDSGLYVCEAYNQYGSQRDSVEVIVKGEFLHGIEHVVSTVAQTEKKIITVKKKWSYLIIYNFKYSSISTYNVNILILNWIQSKCLALRFASFSFCQNIMHSCHNLMV